eukprot:TRINITY_DN8927_c0_g1_i2.p1 TRINITY_DN8927_c0_g1~~TRINITY_DN8927_c0_g1_i2.p1  ORF type:complete len:380 (+),score=30.86 TRINITY_DN8927_c0_g1_i2:475-1614(+)
MREDSNDAATFCHRRDAEFPVVYQKLLKLSRTLVKTPSEKVLNLLQQSFATISPCEEDNDAADFTIRHHFDIAQSHLLLDDSSTDLAKYSLHLKHSHRAQNVPQSRSSESTTCSTSLPTEATSTKPLETLANDDHHVNQEPVAIPQLRSSPSVTVLLLITAETGPHTFLEPLKKLYRVLRPYDRVALTTFGPSFQRRHRLMLRHQVNWEREAKQFISKPAPASSGQDCLVPAVKNSMDILCNFRRIKTVHAGASYRFLCKHIVLTTRPVSKRQHQSLAAVVKRVDKLPDRVTYHMDLIEIKLHDQPGKHGSSTVLATPHPKCSHHPVAYGKEVDATLAAICRQLKSSMPAKKKPKDSSRATQHDITSAIQTRPSSEVAI